MQMSHILLIDQQQIISWVIHRLAPGLVTFYETRFWWLVSIALKILWYLSTPMFSNTLELNINFKILGMGDNISVVSSHEESESRLAFCYVQAIKNFMKMLMIVRINSFVLSIKNPGTKFRNTFNRNIVDVLLWFEDKCRFGSICWATHRLQTVYKTCKACWPLDISQIVSTVIIGWKVPAVRFTSVMSTAYNHHYVLSDIFFRVLPLESP